MTSIIGYFGQWPRIAAVGGVTHGPVWRRVQSEVQTQTVQPPSEPLGKRLLSRAMQRQPLLPRLQIPPLPPPRVQNERVPEFATAPPGAIGWNR